VAGLLGLMLLAFGLAALSGYTDEAAARSVVGRWAAELDAPVFAVLIVALLAADLALPLPSSVLMTGAGAGLGLVGGLLAGTVGCLLGALVGHHLCLRHGRPWLARRVSEAELDRAEAWFARWGPWAIVLSRPVPMLPEAVSCLAGLSGMRRAPFVAFTLLGTVPTAAVYAAAGAWSREGGLGWALLGALGLPALALLLSRLGHRRSTQPSRKGADDAR